MIRVLTPDFAVAPQIEVDDLAEIAGAGFVAVINNRPEDEETGQPVGAALEAAAAASGLSYVAIPVGHAGFGHPQLDAMAAALASATGPVLAFCRSGTRSCNLWALTMAKGGADPEALVRQAAGAGYDLSGIRPTLDALAAGA
ncbi:MAG: TIGR01244 family phosphatase [Sphingomonas sp.]|uniref:TIGR01244 family sulfur transferase n=1 Tax=Sphingomonas sp. TaxID=28214 RepID=UPI0035A9073E|nr:TIGR01244 family phosphatase [Sphingomonas sp.]